MMNRVLRFGMGVCLAALPAVGMAAAPAVTANVSVDSVYYSYVDKLSGMGYITSLPNGARPYSRMEMAKWVQEAEKTAKRKPMPGYLQDVLQAMETEFAPELATLQGHRTYDGVRLHSATAALAYQGGDASSYRYNSGVHGSWQPFGANRNGYQYGADGNAIASFEASGMIGPETAVYIRPRVSYDKDNHLSMSLEEGYIKTRSGIWAFEAGRQAMRWGQGATGTLALSNTMSPLTTLQAHFMEPQKVGGFFRFLGQADVHLFYGKLESDRSDRAAAYGRTDYDDAGLLGMRVDITPTSYVTVGLERISMLGGNGNGLNASDWGHWIYGRNDDNRKDRWDDIAGVDFRLRFPGVQLYGELYGEDQAGYLPSDIAYRAGVYLPQLTKDGSWDMTAEIVNTNNSWYIHSKFQNGWTYRGDIIGDAMGTNARKYYVGLTRHFRREGTIGVYVMRTDMDRGTAQHPTVDEIGITGQRKLRANVYLNGTIGAARVEHANYTSSTDHDTFALASVKWLY